MSVGNVETEADLQRFVETVVDGSPRSAVAPGFHAYPEVKADDVPAGSVFVDEADSTLKFKDGAGSLHALY